MKSTYNFLRDSKVPLLNVVGYLLKHVFVCLLIKQGNFQMPPMKIFDI